ncbi:SRPBCC family protein [Paractinoplanes rhizophilus]|jgi:carbon monoxide dehydrogenase subunit G|uniref:SRPBCC family protein n=1 Tax=Paractinoplanes rhizophilus TaxID=1416877 RepID=A0ABW2I088_9ACTN|nr:SRPBCC family protein [Actinoplanes sp.]
MIVVERTFAVTAPPDAVLAYLRDFANAREWDPSARATHRLGAGPIVPGAHWRHVRKLLGVTAELTYTLIAADPGRLVFHARSEGATCVDTVTLGPVAGGTEVSYRSEIEMHGLAKLATPVIRAEIEKLASGSVAAVRAALEGTAVHRRFGAATPNRLTTPVEETG